MRVVNRRPRTADADEQIPAFASAAVDARVMVIPVADRREWPAFDIHERRRDSAKGAFPEVMMERASRELLHAAYGHQVTLIKVQSFGDLSGLHTIPSADQDIFKSPTAVRSARASAERNGRDYRD